MKFIKLFTAMIALCVYSPVFGAILNSCAGMAGVVAATPDNTHCCMEVVAFDDNGGSDCYQYFERDFTNGTSSPMQIVCKSRTCAAGEMLLSNRVSVCGPYATYLATNTVCETCSSGQYIHTGVCTACPDGYSGSDNGRDSISDCYKNCLRQIGGDDTGTWQTPVAKVYWSI